MFWYWKSGNCRNILNLVYVHNLIQCSSLSQSLTDNILLIGIWNRFTMEEINLFFLVMHVYYFACAILLGRYFFYCGNVCFQSCPTNRDFQMSWNNKIIKFWEQFVFVFLIDTYCETPKGFHSCHDNHGFS